MKMEEERCGDEGVFVEVGNVKGKKEKIGKGGSQRCKEHTKD